MKSILEKLFVGKLRQKLVGLIENTLNNNGDFRALKRGQKHHAARLKRLDGLVYDLLPPVFYVNKKTEAAISEFRSTFNLPDDLNVSISKNDVMFHVELVNSGGSVQRAFLDYFLGGLYGLDILKKLSEVKFGGLSKADAVLDFACGYGRISRFLLTELPAEKVWVSDVRHQGVDFQKETFGFNGVYSSFTPSEFDPQQTFDAIFVGSLFSHLDEEPFLGWLRKLFDCLSDRGFLALSVHDISLNTSKKGENFTFRDSSEDIVFSEIEDSIDDGGAYGTAYVSEARMHDFMKKMDIDPARCVRIPKAFGGLQDVYVISRDKNVFDPSQIKLEKFYELM